MMRFVERLRAIGLTRAALLLAAAALAAIAYVGVREAQVGPRAEAGAATAQEQATPARQDNSEEQTTSRQPPSR